MQLRFSPTSPFARKVRVVIHELALLDRIQLVPTDPWTDETLRPFNPLNKVPTLIFADGDALYDSTVIVEYLDSEFGRRLLPPEGAARWRALRLQALGNAIAEAAIRRLNEQKAPASDHSAGIDQRQAKAIAASLDALEQEASSFPESPTIGELAIAVALGYLDFRFSQEDWRAGRPHLANWYQIIANRPSLLATEPSAAPIQAQTQASPQASKVA